jgi:2,4-diaminopentanoate dehydrogenase
MINIIQLGMGPLGCKMTNYIRDRKTVRTVAAVDPDPRKAGTDVGELAGGTAYGVEIRSDLRAALWSAEHRPQVALVTTVSDMERITPQIAACLEQGLAVVSTCEELFYPWDEAPELAGSLDQLAKDNGVALVGTGVNPGFLMDTLPAQLTAVCQRVDRVEVHRVQDASKRRLPFQRKIGAGLSPEEFASRKADGSLRHVGLTESMQFIAQALGWTLDHTEDIIEPIIVDEERVFPDLRVSPGYAAGVLQTGNGYIGDEAVIRLIFRAAVGESESYDEVIVHGEPNLRSRIEGGVNGDVATCAISINACRSVLEASPGLHTMASLPMVSNSR